MTNNDLEQIRVVVREEVASDKTTHDLTVGDLSLES